VTQSTCKCRWMLPGHARSCLPLGEAGTLNTDGAVLRELTGNVFLHHTEFQGAMQQAEKAAASSSGVLVLCNRWVRR